MNDFLQWLLWGFGEGEERPRVSPEVNEFWYRTFNLGLMLKHPYDYFGDIFCEKKSGFWNNPNAFFPTPHPLCEMMIRLQFDDQEDLRSKKVFDPCVGTGRMLLHASNYSFHLYGQDIDFSCVMACKINGYLYMPWLVRPALEPDEPLLLAEPETALEVVNTESPEQYRVDNFGQLQMF